MNKKHLVKLSNVIGILSILLLLYWVFVFISITVFGLKVFRENITETFYMSVMGILALMFGALMINMMLNLTRIAEKHNRDDAEQVKKSSKSMLYLFILSFPVIFALLFFGDYLTTLKKEKTLIATAESILSSDNAKKDKLLHYAFTREWIKETAGILDFYSNIDRDFPSVSIIVEDTIDSTPVFLGFDSYVKLRNDTIPPVKNNYILKTNQEERTYLNDVFTGKTKEVFFDSHKGNYRLFFPHSKNGRMIVLSFSDYQSYGDSFGKY